MKTAINATAPATASTKSPAVDEDFATVTAGVCGCDTVNVYPKTFHRRLVK